jgi:hypothetical protein
MAIDVRLKINAVDRVVSGCAYFPDVPKRADLKNRPRNLHTTRISEDIRRSLCRRAPFLVAVNETRSDAPDIGTRADGEQHDQQERLEVEQR